MDQFGLQAFVFWPGVVIVSALLSMLTVLKFSWSELVIGYMVGVVLGTFFFLGTQPNPSGVMKFFLVFSHGLWGLLHLTGTITTQTSLFEVAAGSTVGATLAAGLFDLATQAIGKDRNWGSAALSFFINLPLKLPFALFTSGVGVVFFIVGALRSIAPDGEVGLNGTLYVEWSSPGSGAATTLGATVQVWTGRMSSLIDHEMYHSRQYIYMRDWMIPAWLVGGIWGLISSAVDGKFDINAFRMARSDREVGNPLERVPYQISGGALA